MKCPHCDGEVESRAKMGLGTRRALGMKVNTNRQAILDAMKEFGKPVSVRDVQHLLVTRNVQRVSKRNTGWNYHTVQADLSILIGMGKITMTKPLAQELFDRKEGFTSNRVPMYSLKDEIPSERSLGSFV